MLRCNGFLLCFAAVAICVTSTKAYGFADIDDERCNLMTSCIEIYRPVCGSDGKTYPNDCFLASCPGVTLVHEGECKAKRQRQQVIDADGCDRKKLCSLIDEPVCGSDGITYGNYCQLSRCPGVKVVHEGKCGAEKPKLDDNGCDQREICPLIDEPICGSDGKTYGNACELLRCRGVTFVHEGECQAEGAQIDDGCDQTKICSLIDEPVCGSDGKTYRNDCELSRCPGVTVVHDEQCQVKARQINRKVHQQNQRNQQNDFNILAFLFDLLNLSGKL